MQLIHFPPERVLEINSKILESEPGHCGQPDYGGLCGALARVDNAICYSGLDDVFEIAASYAQVIAVGHNLSDANKRTGLAVCLEYLSLNDYELTHDNDQLADAMVDLVKGELTAVDFADVLYSLWADQQG
ncbi:type II toxin-antitoxin system death-on-curing family toxin [Marinobacterium jannaschii]|uniref:type II toxin-antitoxin system death-on-curing family toxin n=1 Tax=Marinobacterium jannaschii TaxID=64970 RepID=UPI0004894364|nr:type II toxin-antitoxin system death-on-curing family toxin [Marinobacterium jannaschii]